MKKDRFQLDMTPEQVALLDTLVEKTGVSTRAELVRNALRFYSWLVDLDPEQLIEVKKPDGEVVFLGKAKLLNRVYK